MPRSSRHKSSHRQRRRSRERSDSDSDGRQGGAFDERWSGKESGRRRSEKEREREHRGKRSREDVVEDVEIEHSDVKEVVEVVREKSSEREREREHSGRKSGSRSGDGEFLSRGHQEVADQHEIDGLHNPNLHKEASKKIKRKDYYGDKEKRYEHDRDITERKISSTYDRNSNSKDEKYKEERYREKYRDDFDRDEKPRYDKYRDGRSSRDHTSVRPDIKHTRDETRHSENHNKRSKIEENGVEKSPLIDEYGMKCRDGREKKKFSDDSVDPNSRIIKEHRMVDNSLTDIFKVEPIHDRGRAETPRVKASVDNNLSVISSNSSSQIVKKECRSLEQVEATNIKTWSEEQHYINVSGDSLESTKCISSAPGMLDKHSIERKSTPRDCPRNDILVENVPASSPAKSNERTPSSSSRRHSSRLDSVHHTDVESEHTISHPKDGRGHTTNGNKEQDFRQEKHEAANVNVKMELPNDDSVPIGSVPSTRADHFSSCSASPLRPSSVRHGMGSPISSADGDRFQSGDRKFNNRYKRPGDFNMGRGHGNAMKGVLNWPSPIPNGFVPFQHGPPPGGFFPIPQPFPAPMFGIRPPMDLNQSGNHFHMSDNSDRFSNHNRPFGWRNPADDPFPPNLHGWDGNNMFNDGSYMHYRSDWDQKKQLFNNSCPEMSSELLKNQNGNTSLTCPNDKEIVSSKIVEDETGQQLLNTQLPKPETKEVKNTIDDHTTKIKKESSPKSNLGKPSMSSNLSDDINAAFCRTCLSKLDISPDLVSPELYGLCLKKVDSKGSTANEGDNMAKNVGGVMFAARLSSRAKGPLFPALADDVFQRALLLYRKNKDANAHTPIFQAKEKMDTSETPEVQQAVTIKKLPLCDADTVAKENVCSSMEEDTNNLGEEPKKDESNLLSVAKDLSEPEAAQDNNIPFAAHNVVHDEHSDMLVSPAGSVEGGQSYVPSSPAGCAEGPLECVAIVPECMVNLGRIHHSPESTH